MTTCNGCGSTFSKLRFPGTAVVHSGTPDVSSFRCTHSGYGKHYPIVECLGCGLVYAVTPFQSQFVLEAYETVEDVAYLEEREGRRLTFEKHLEAVEKYRKPPGTLLDVGAYTGVFLEAAQKNGWTATGVEPSKWASNQAQLRGLSVLNGTLQSEQLRPASFDVVTLWDVIEHFSDPAAELRRVHELLAPGGLAVVHTMDIDSVTAKIMGRRWPWLMEMHLFYFSRQTLSRALERAGFRVLRCSAAGRYLRSSYLASRLGGLLGERTGHLIGRGISALGMGDLVVPVNFGDLFTAYAVKD